MTRTDAGAAEIATGGTVSANISFMYNGNQQFQKVGEVSWKAEASTGGNGDDDDGATAMTTYAAAVVAAIAALMF